MSSYLGVLHKELKHQNYCIYVPLLGTGRDPCPVQLQFNTWRVKYWIVIHNAERRRLDVIFKEFAPTFINFFIEIQIYWSHFPIPHLIHSKHIGLDLFLTYFQKGEFDCIFLFSLLFVVMILLRPFTTLMNRFRWYFLFESFEVCLKFKWDQY